MYKLRSTLTGHELDVRGVTAVSNDIIVSGSRDGTARLWDIQYQLDTITDNEICFLSPTGSFVNAVEHFSIDGESYVAIGGKDATIYISGIHNSYAKPGDDFGRYQLVGHQGNVCSLNYSEGVLLSGSWDCTAKVWDLSSFGVQFDLVGHQASVWDAKVVDAEANIYLTCSADRTIRKWQGAKEIAQYTGHNDVVRKLLVLPDKKRFVSASNDCTLKVWDLETGAVLQTLTGHDSFIYDVAVLSTGDLVSTAEDRTVRIWHNGVVLQAITLPCISVWCVTVLPNDDFAVGGSDKQVYVFTNNAERTATADGLAQFKNLVEKSAISEQSVDDLKKTDIPGYDRLERPGKEEGSTIMVKSPAGVIEAHQWSGGEWIKIGDVVSSAGGSTGKKEHKGKEYDYVFDVDVEDGKPPLKLPYNAGENPYSAAERFLAENDLPGSYTEEVVRFINQNTSGFQLDEQASSNASNNFSNNESGQSKQKPAPAAASSFFPQTNLITFNDFKPEQLIKGFNKFNSEQNSESAFSQLEVQKVEKALADLNSKNALYLILSVIPKILGQWSVSQKLVGFDMLRVSILRVSTSDLLQSTEAAETIVKLLLQSLDESSAETITVTMMIFKVLCCLSSSVLLVQLFLTADILVTFNPFFDQVIEKALIALKIITTSPTAQSSKHYKNTLSAAASFVFDLSAYTFSKKSLKIRGPALKPILKFLNDVAKELIVDEECAYRLCVAFGNLKIAGGVSETPGWYTTCEKKYTSGRFAEVYKEIARI